MIELNGSQWVMLGKLLGAHGILGGLKVKLDNPQSQSLQKGARVALQTANNWIFDEVRSWSGSGILALSNIHDRDQAAAAAASGRPRRRTVGPAAFDAGLWKTRGLPGHVWG